MVNINVQWKHYFKTKLYVVSFIFALVGCFILSIYLFGQFFEKEIFALEGTVQSPVFTWGIRIFIITLVILLIKGNERIQKFFVNKSVRWAVYTLYLIGALGWLAWFLRLFSN
jgi:hypothetical protein